MNINELQQSNGHAMSCEAKPDPMDDKQPCDKTIGSYLKDEREKKGLSYTQISEITKLRPSILETLENQSWENLPSPVFAKSFVQAYGRALGLEEKEITTLYEKSGPVRVSAPKPLSEPAKNKKNSFIIVVFLLLAISSFYYFWKGYSIQGNFATIPMETGSEKSKTTLFEKTGDNHDHDEPRLLKKEDQIETLPKMTDESKQIKELLKKNNALINNADTTVSTESIAPELTLKADIREKTWVKLIIDDNEPKEYMFRPGRHYEWKAEKSFELMIGNAGGIDLEFNGRKVAKPLKAGQVVRVRLPENYERNVLQE